MTYILEIFFGDEGDSKTRSFRTLRGATSAGCRSLKAHGYLHANRFEGRTGCGRHIVAEWKDSRGKQIARVWT